MNINYNKYADGLVPAIVQDATTNKILMLGFMNEAAFETTLALKKITFFSRTKNRLWTKGEESGHFLFLESWKIDCDNDTLLIKAKPNGPVCHTGADTCFEENNHIFNLEMLEAIIEQRKTVSPDQSYVAKMFQKGLNKIAQKVGEEAVELVIEAKDDNESLFLNEAADLVFHYLLLLNAKGYKLQDVLNVLAERHNKK
ncbi:MAG: bifunctional phosphoribosyl-AMP cyclohydrolase/phosphoribosyl-ATP diphosphatase HisIE [Chitinophagaceae bacterium]